jgi:DNA-binding NarL/FixJ family response regulator
MITLIIADDHQVMLQGLLKLFQDDNQFDVLSSASSFHQAIYELKKHKPQVLLTDITFPDGDGITLFKNTRIFHPEIKCICLTMHRELAYVSKANQSGIHAYLPKETDIEEIKKVILGVMNGNLYYDQQLLELSQASVTESSPLKEKLSLREIEIIQLLNEGLSTKDIAEKIHLSPYTVDTHRKNINSKLNVKNLGELLKVARQEGIILME